MFEPGDLVLVCVSGGPDSVCLLYSLWYLRRLCKIKLEVFHFDHRLRPDSGKDAEYVRRLGERLSVPVHVETAESTPRKGESREAWATMARWRAANEIRKGIRADVVVEGHTLDDQAETVLLNLIRGTGLEGMTGIRPGSRKEPFMVQPLIDVERSEVEGFCRALHLRPRQDPMNRDLSLLRNALRRRGIPALERATGRAIKYPIVRTAELLRADRRELEIQASRALHEILVGEWSFPMTLEAAALRELPRPVASRALRLAMYRIASGEAIAPETKDGIEAVLDLAHGRPGRRRDLPQGLKAVRDKEYVRVSRPSPEVDTKEGKR
jgi:tRNA(Ile)-lysidine synthase